MNNFFIIRVINTINMLLNVIKFKVYKPISVEKQNVN